jgi:hypothetical protein
MYENRTRDSGITTRGFTTKLTSPLTMARPERFELPTTGFEDRDSIQLS